MSDKKLPSWQADNFSDLNFFFLDFQKMAGKLWIGRSSAWNFFDFFNGICGAEKSERSWESGAWELREFSEKIKKKLEKSEFLKFLEKKIWNFEVFLFFLFFFFIKNVLQFFPNFLLIFYFLVIFLF